MAEEDSDSVLSYTETDEDDDDSGQFSEPFEAYLTRRARQHFPLSLSLNDNFIQCLRDAVASLGYSSPPVLSRRQSEMLLDFSSGDCLCNRDFRGREFEYNIQFDTDQPSEHHYLRVVMNRVSGVKYFKPDSETRLLMFCHHNIVFPNEVLPFMICNTVFELNEKNIDGVLFGVCFPFLRGNGNEEYMYGVTCQIYEKGVSEGGFCAVKSRAMQRFITRTKNLSNLEYLSTLPTKKCYGVIKILQDIFLPEPIKCINMASMSRFRENDSMAKLYKRFQMSTTPWPSYIYDNYNISNIIEKAQNQLVKFKIFGKPSDPMQLSFWLARNMHISEDIISQIFMTDSVNLRLKLISETFKEDAVFICRFCGNAIANCSELFAMSKHGVQAQYCNPTGFIKEVNTVYSVLQDAILYSSYSSSSQYSWFYGYEWIIINCKGCARQIGFEFKAYELHLLPRNLFALMSSSVRIGVPNVDQTNLNRPVCRHRRSS